MADAAGVLPPGRQTLALAGWSLAHGLSHLLIDGAFNGLPMPAQQPDTLARTLSAYLFT